MTETSTEDQCPCCGGVATTPIEGGVGCDECGAFWEIRGEVKRVKIPIVIEIAEFILDTIGRREVLHRFHHCLERGALKNYDEIIDPDTPCKQRYVGYWGLSDVVEGESAITEGDAKWNVERVIHEGTQTHVIADRVDKDHPEG